MQVINLDLSAKGIIPLLQAKQGDVGRKFQAVITDGGTAYDIPSGTNLAVWYSGTSGEGNYSHIGLDDDFLQSRSAFTISGNTVTVELVAQMLACAGGGTMCLVMNGAEGEQIATWNIPYLVEKIPGANSEGATQYYTAYAQAAMKEMSSALLNALEYAKESGEFDGPQGEKGEKGDPGAQGPKGEDGFGEKVDRYCADCHAVTECGLYYIDDNTLNRPDGVTTGTLFAERVQKSSGIDTHLTLRDGATILRCHYSSVSSSWQEWEWENPPYTLNKVYRTTEKNNGYPVYAVKVGIGGVAHGNLNVTISGGFTDDPAYVVNGWSVIGFDGIVIHNAIYSSQYERVGDYSAGKFVKTVKGQFSAGGLSITLEMLDDSSLGSESDVSLTVKFIKA